MKTAEEILRALVQKEEGKVITDDYWNDVIKSKEAKVFLQAMNEYASEACKCQREICARSVVSHWAQDPSCTERILNAPSPNLK